MGAALAQVNGGALGEGPWGARPRRVAAPGGPRRAHLTVVPDLPAAPPSRGGRATGVVKLTRLGRLAITLMAAAVLLGTSVLAASAAGVGPFGGPVSGERVVVVESGQTLSGLAESYLPDRVIGDGVAAIQIANGLSSEHVQAGQRLVIPAR